jgi:hypothetical protein
MGSLELMGSEMGRDMEMRMMRWRGRWLGRGVMIVGLNAKGEKTRIRVWISIRRCREFFMIMMLELVLID